MKKYLVIATSIYLLLGIIIAQTENVQWHKYYSAYPASPFGFTLVVLLWPFEIYSNLGCPHVFIGCTHNNNDNEWNIPTISLRLKDFFSH